VRAAKVWWNEHVALTYVALVLLWAALMAFALA
jgi:hypothetical protein